VTTPTPTIPLETQQRHAATFAALHHDPPVVLANAWDVGSARLIAASGAKAIATSSGGHSWSLGLPDGNHLDRVQVVELVRAIAGVVDLPVSADIETGYADTLDELAATTRVVLDAGAVGVNLEDSGGDPLYTAHEQADRIAAVRQAATRYGVDLFINARTDVFLMAVGDEEGRLDDVIARANAYAAAGANAIFVPGLLDLDALRTLAEATTIPVNAMIGPGAPSVAELVAAGVTRISAGTGLAQSAYAHAQRAARELFGEGTYGALDETIDYFELNADFSRGPG